MRTPRILLQSRRASWPLDELGIQNLRALIEAMAIIEVETRRRVGWYVGEPFWIVERTVAATRTAGAVIR